MTVEQVGSDIPRTLEELPEKFDDFKAEFNEFKYKLLADYERMSEAARSYRTRTFLFWTGFGTGFAVGALLTLMTIFVLAVYLEW